ncbi:MAG: hypothetical protein AAFQ79_07885 [Pseudomonadota bacterium]
MSTATARRGVLALPGRLVGLIRDLILGTLFCLTPVTALIALGWLTRVMGATIDRHRGQAPEPVGWILGPKGQGGIARALGGLGANIRSGVMTAAGLAVFTLPFTLAWLGAWWAGWENSFNKGYEQASVGPLIWFAGTALALPVLAHLPFALAHFAAERRWPAFFELRRIHSVFAAAGWRAVWLALLSALTVVPFFGLRAMPVFVEGIVPGFAEMTPEAQLQVARGFMLAGAALSFAVLLFLRTMAARLYARSIPRAAARWPALWPDVRAEGAVPSRVMRWVWLGLAMLVWLAVPVSIVFGQFMNYDPVLWLTHPLYLLPWAG